MSGMAEVLEELWDQGNCAGLDGWIGLGRGQRNFDEEAVQIRRRDVEKAVAALTAAGFGPVKEAAAVALEEAADAWREYLPAVAGYGKVQPVPVWLERRAEWIKR